MVKAYASNHCTQMIFIIISDLIVAVKRVRRVGWGLNRQKLNVKLNMTFVKSTYWTNVKVTHVSTRTSTKAMWRQW